MTDVFTDGTVRIGPVNAILDVLVSSGVDPAEALSEAGIDPLLFDDPDNLLSFSSRAHMMHLCQELTGWPHFGILVGQRGGLSSFGMIGYLAMHSSSVEEAIRSLVNYLHLHVHGASGILEDMGNSAFFGYEIYQQVTVGNDLIEDAALAVMYNILRELCGNGWGPIEVWFTHREPENITPYREVFHVPLRFDMDKSGLFFSTRWLRRPVRAADPTLHDLLQKQIDELESRHRDDFPEQVRRVLHNALLTRHVGAEEVAALFSIHSRTLHRRLKAHDTSFRELADECRFTIARQMLETSNASLVQIAELLDYADTGAFGRAFRRWSGVPPARWRKEQSK